MGARDWTGPWVDAGPGKPGLAREWARALAPYAAPGTGRAEVELLLRGHLETLHDALLAEPPGRPAAAGVGAALAGLARGRPDALEVVLPVLADRLLADLGLDGATFAPALHTLLGAVAAGYARAALASAVRATAAHPPG